MDTVNGRVHRATGGAAGRSPRDRTHPSPCGAGRSVHRGVRRDPGGRVVLDVQPSRRPLLGATRLGRSAGVGPCRGRPARRRGHPDVGSGRDRPPPRSSAPASVSWIEAHYPNRRSDPLHREPKARSAAEAAFLAIGPGAAAWLVEAAGVGTRSIEHKMAEAVELTKVFDRDAVDRALGQAAIACRFTIADLLSILTTPPPSTTHRVRDALVATRHRRLAPHRHPRHPTTSTRSHQ